MNVKNFIVGGIVGGIVDFLLGWVVYGMLLKDTFPKSACDGPAENMLFIFLGCMSFGFLISWVFSQGEGISNMAAGIKMALGISVLMGMCSWFFMNMTQETIDVKLMAIDIVAGMVLATGVGAAVAMVNGKMK
ncbi:hypothetical protein [Flavobacterium sangjuense]|uniref:DUF1761 domain-containing protein n=1 Tax=Flavobacterium sangjuense TaxID=2518177 RepID=A0A4P7PWW4_9FLAO|nr:hypothetical protein [Flavobacterium sangjuense]QBZ98503.1 hypothetical protein GS03_02011 [Flavobacterium sangjuense]